MISEGIKQTKKEFSQEIDKLRACRQEVEGQVGRTSNKQCIVVKTFQKCGEKGVKLGQIWAQT